MESENQLPTQTTAQVADPELAAETQEIAAEEALVPSPDADAANAYQPIQLSEPLRRLPAELDVAVPIRDFRVRNLINLETGQLIAAQWSHGEDLPLQAGNVQLAWVEFEVVDTQLAVRVTRLA